MRGNLYAFPIGRKPQVADGVEARKARRKAGRFEGFPVVAIGPDLTRRKFASATLAAAELGIPAVGIYECCNGRMRSSHGWRFHYDLGTED